MGLFARTIAAACTGALALVVGPVSAAHAEVGHRHHRAQPHVVFVQTNDPGGNAVLVYDRADDGTLSPAGSYATGGIGGAEIGAVVDPLASQGSVAYDAENNVLIVTNAGSDSLSVFGVHGDNLTLRQVVASGGAFPTSVAVRGHLVYALDAGGAGAVQAYGLAGGRLHRIAGSNRSLGLPNTNPPAFSAAPGQIVISPDSRHVIVTTKSNGSIDVFGVSASGRLSAVPTLNPPAGTTPFSSTFDGAGHLVVVEAGTNSVTTYAVNTDNTLTTVSGPVSDGQSAACWIAGAANGLFYVANAGSSTLSGYRVAHDGTVTLLAGATATSGGPIDLTASSDGRFLYSENGGAGTIDEFQIQPDGSLTSIGHITGLAAHVIEGITAT